MKTYRITLEIMINEQDHQAGAFGANAIVESVNALIYSRCCNNEDGNVCAVSAVNIVRPMDTIGDLEKAGKL